MITTNWFNNWGRKFRKKDLNVGPNADKTKPIDRSEARYREIKRLKEVEKLSHKEIAELLGISEETVSKIYNHNRKTRQT